MEHTLLALGLLGAFCMLMLATFEASFLVLQLRLRGIASQAVLVVAASGNGLVVTSPRRPRENLGVLTRRCLR